MDGLAQGAVAELNLLRADLYGYTQYVEEAESEFTVRGTIQIDGRRAQHLRMPRSAEDSYWPAFSREAKLPTPQKLLAPRS